MAPVLRRVRVVMARFGRHLHQNGSDRPCQSIVQRIVPIPGRVDYPQLHHLYHAGAFQYVFPQHDSAFVCDEWCHGGRFQRV